MDWAKQMVDLLTQASELAYVEGAQGTARLLGCARRLLLYRTRPREWAPLSDERKALEDVIAIRKARFGNRIRLSCAPDVDLFVPYACLIDTVEEICPPSAFLDDVSAEFEIILERTWSLSGGYALRMAIRRTSRGETYDTVRSWPL